MSNIILPPAVGSMPWPENLAFLPRDNKFLIVSAPYYTLDEHDRRVKDEGPKLWEPVQLVSQTIRLICYGLHGYAARCDCGERSRFYAKLTQRVKDSLYAWAIEHECIQVNPLSASVHWSQENIV